MFAHTWRSRRRQLSIVVVVVVVFKSVYGGQEFLSQGPNVAAQCLALIFMFG